MKLRRIRGGLAWGCLIVASLVLLSFVVGCGEPPCDEAGALAWRMRYRDVSVDDRYAIGSGAGAAMAYTDGNRCAIADLLDSVTVAIGDAPSFDGDVLVVERSDCLQASTVRALGLALGYSEDDAEWFAPWPVGAEAKALVADCGVSP